MNTRTRPERNLETLEHEPEKMRLENDRYTENEIKKMPNWAECLWQTAPKQLDLRKYFGNKNYD